MEASEGGAFFQGVGAGQRQAQLDCGEHGEVQAQWELWRTQRRPRPCTGEPSGAAHGGDTREVQYVHRAQRVNTPTCTWGEPGLLVAHSVGTVCVGPAKGTGPHAQHVLVNWRSQFGMRGRAPYSLGRKRGGAEHHSQGGPLEGEQVWCQPGQGCVVPLVDVRVSVAVREGLRLPGAVSSETTGCTYSNTVRFNK